MGKSIKRAVTAVATMGQSEVIGGLFDAASGDRVGGGKSAAQMRKEAQVKADKSAALRAAALSRNKTVFSSGDDEDVSVAIPNAQKSLFNKKKLG